MRLSLFLTSVAASALGLSAAAADPITIYAPWPADRIA